MAVEGTSERVKRIHKEATIVDMLEALFPPRDIGYFKRAVDSGITAINTTIPHVGDELPGAIEKTAQFMKLVENSENAEFVTSVADIERCKKEGKLGIIAGMQDSIPFERDLDLIRVFYQLGYRVQQVAYIRQNYLGAGCVESVDHGLTDRGKEAVKEFNRLGMLIDTSHCGDQTTIDTAKASKDPIAITHTAPAALVDIPRARSDEAIKTVAERGGVIGQVAWSAFNERKGKLDVRATMSDYVDMLEYMANLVGIDHVGLGLDVSPFYTVETYETFMRDYGIALIYPHKPKPFDQKYVEGFKDIEDTINVTGELLKHGFSDDDTKKVLGGNWLGLLKQVWK